MKQVASFPGSGKSLGTRLDQKYPQGIKGSMHYSFSYPEPFLCAVRRGALAKSISELASGWLVLTPDIVFLPCFYSIRFWIWPEPVTPRVKRALGTRMDPTLSGQDVQHSRTQSPSYARSTERDEGLWPNPYQTGI